MRNSKSKGLKFSDQITYEEGAACCMPGSPANNYVNTVEALKSGLIHQRICFERQYIWKLERSMPSNP